VVAVGSCRDESMHVVGCTTDDQRTGVRHGEWRDLEWCSPGLTISGCGCLCPAGTGCQPHEDSRFGIALVRQSAWRRWVDGLEHFVDAGTGHFVRAGEVVEVAHFVDELHSGTAIDVDPDTATPAVAEVGTASGPFIVTPEIDLAHRLLASAIGRGAVDDVEEQALSLISAVLSQVHPGFSDHSRRTTSIARRRLVGDVCEQLHRTPNLSLVELARSVHYSPFHLSRVFREVTGVTISRYRTQLRIHEVLMRLEEGATDLNRLAAETGFADHSHMTRTLMARLGQTPSALRECLRRTRA
jgi:AraC-like DNA-binding protein